MQQNVRVVTVTSPPERCNNASCGAPKQFLSSDVYERRPAWICDRCGLVHSLAASARSTK